MFGRCVIYDAHGHANRIALLLERFHARMRTDLGALLRRYPRERLHKILGRNDARQGTSIAAVPTMCGSRARISAGPISRRPSTPFARPRASNAWSSFSSREKEKE